MMPFDGERMLVKIPPRMTHDRKYGKQVTVCTYPENSLFFISFKSRAKITGTRIPSSSLNTAI